MSRDTTRPVCVHSEQDAFHPFNSVLITSHRIQRVNYFLLLTDWLAALSIWCVLQHTRFILSTVLISARSELIKPYQLACAGVNVFIHHYSACLADVEALQHSELALSTHQIVKEQCYRLTPFNTLTLCCPAR